MNTANQNKGKNNDESESKQTNLGAGKRVLPRRHRFKFCICRAEKVAPVFCSIILFWINYRA